MAKLNNAISTFPIIYTDLHMKVIYMMYYDEFLKLPDQRMQDKKAIQLNEESIITFNHVSYRYPHSESDILKDISFTLQNSNCRTKWCWQDNLNQIAMWAI